MNSKLTSLQSSITALQNKLIYETQVVTVKNIHYYYFTKPGYMLISAINGDFDAKSVQVTSVARQNNTNIVFFEKAVNGSMRINLLWAKE